MGFFDSILGAIESVTSRASETIEKIKSPSSSADLISSMVRGRTSEAPQIVETNLPKARTSSIPIAQPLSSDANASDIVQSVNQIGRASTSPPSVFSSMFGGAKPDISEGLTFEAPVYEGEPADVFENIFYGAKTEEEATAYREMLKEKSFYTYIDRGVGGILPGGEPFVNPFKGMLDFSATTKLALFGLGAIAVWQLTKRK